MPSTLTLINGHSKESPSLSLELQLNTSLTRSVHLTVIFRPRTDSLYLQVSEGDVATTLSTDMGVVEMQEMPSSRSGGDVQHLA